MREIKIFDNGVDGIQFQQKVKNEAESIFMLGATLIACARRLGIDESRLNELMGTLWEEGAIEEESK